MNRVSLWAIAALGLLSWASTTQAADLHERLRCAPWAPNCITSWLCDDYCPKPEPKPLCVKTCTLPDDYCSKPEPCIKKLCIPTVCDDYCAKPLPLKPCEFDTRCKPAITSKFVIPFWKR